MSTIAARRTEELTQHYATLEALARHCGVDQPNGKKLSVALLKLEREAHQVAEDYCNGTRFTESETAWETFKDGIEAQVQALFNGKLAGFFVNGDPRGSALKLDQNHTIKASGYGIELHRDWGGYGLLSPEITGR